MKQIRKVVKTTVGCILIKNKKILLEKRNVDPERNKWCFPGGHMEQGETAENAVRREIREETDLEIDEMTFFTYDNEIFPSRNQYSVVLIFSGTPKGTTRINEESSEFNWFSKEELAKLDMACNHKSIAYTFFKDKKI